MVKAVFFVSSLSGSGIDNCIPRFILEASSFQFEIPTNAILFFPSSRASSNSAWITLRGLLGECSARPISSKKIIEIFFFLFSTLKLSNCFLALLKIFSTPFDVLAIEPWYELKINLGKVWKRGLSEASPFIDLLINWILKDLLHPGLPTINIGILLLIATNNEKILSNKALFCAIPSSNSILPKTYFSSLNGISMKSIFGRYL